VTEADHGNTMPNIEFYLSLGDSISDNDHYAASDAAQKGLSSRGFDGGLGSASLFWQNDDELWPEFAGNDLRTRFPNARFLHLAQDGGTIHTVRQLQLPQAKAEVGAKNAIVTLSVGGNDTLQALELAGPRDLEPAMRHIERDLAHLVREIREGLPAAHLILTTVYDPTDGTGVLLGHESEGRLPIHLLQQLNEFTRELASSTPNTTLADVERHFFGHGIEGGATDGYYFWPGSIVEPGARGCSEIRRLWLEAIG
jgi:lysophospholipase L1-like esterase